MKLCRGDLAKATYTAQPAVTHENGTSVRKFLCKEYPRLSFTETRGQHFEKTVVFAIDDKPCADITETLALLNEGLKPPPDATPNISAQTIWVT